MKLGVFAPAASVLLPWRVSQPAAEDLLLSGRSIGATEARAIGLVQHVADDPAAAALASGSTSTSPGRAAPALDFALRAARGARATRGAARGSPTSSGCTSTA